MEHGHNTTEGPPLTPTRSRRLLPFSSMMPSPITENQPTSPHPFQLPRQLLNTFAAYPMGEGSQTNEDAYASNPFRPEPSTADIQALTQHLLALTNSTSSSSNPFPGSQFQHHSEYMDKWNKQSCRSLNTSPNAHSCDRTSEETSPVNMSTSALSSTDSTNALTRLASLSKAWSSTSPSTMAALAQLTLLGLSPLTPTRDGPNPLVPSDPNGTTPSAFNLKTSQPMDFDSSTPNGCSSTKNKNSVDLSSSHSPPHNKTDFGSKVIIRQTADADEHFFKALTRLKVDVSPELQSAELRALTSAVKPTTAGLGIPIEQACITQSDKRATTQSNRTAAELAVDEHFEKSLAAFPGFTASRELSGELPGTKTQLSARNQESSFATNVGLCNPHTSSRQRKNSTKSTELTRGRPRVLVRQQSQQEHSPSSPIFLYSADDSRGSLSPDIPQPPPYNRERISYVPELYKSQPIIHHSPDDKSNHLDKMREQLGQNRSSPITTLPDSIKSLPKNISASTNSSGQVSANTFKPKKNWLAQYDWMENQPTAGGVSPESPMYAHPTGSDSVGSSPSFFPIKMETGSTECSRIRSLSSPQKGEETIEKLTEDSVSSFSQCVVPGMEKQSSGGTSQLHQKHTRHFSNSPVQTTIPASFEVNRSQEIPEEVQPCWNDKTGTIVNHAGKATENPFPTASMESAITLQRDSATSPFPGDNPNIQANENVPSERPPSTGPRESQPLGNGKSLISCSLSNPPSPCPIIGEESGVSAVTPVSGATSGFFTGSTYSLDSSLSQTQALSYEPREMDSGIDVKSLSSAAEERSFSESKSQTGVDIATKSEHADSSSLSWSLRKRASSEASPWSTLKRSRSVLTSPISYNETCPSCSPISREMLSEVLDESASSGTDRYAVLNEFTSRSMDGTSRPLTPDLTKPQTNKRLVHSRKVSEMEFKDDEHLQTMESQLPRYYNHCRKPCEHKANSEPSVMSSNPTVASIGRSLSDAATLPSLRLTHDKNVYILR